MFDVTKSWTFDYVKREAPKVPKHIPLLILANFIDQAHHRCISRSQAIGYVRVHDMFSRIQNFLFHFVIVLSLENCLFEHITSILAFYNLF